MTNPHGFELDITDRRTHLIFLAVAIIFSAAYFAYRASCRDEVQYHELQAWTISDTNLNAEIVWQRAEPKALRKVLFILTRQHPFTASQEHVVYVHDADRPWYCNWHKLLIGFDLRSGKEIWRQRIPQHAVIQLTTVKGGYVLLLEALVIKYNNKGEKVWENDEILGRSAAAVYEANNSLYIPSYSTLYQLSLETGEVLQTIDTGKVHGVYDEIAFVAPTKNQLSAVDLANNQKELFRTLLTWTISTNPAPVKATDFYDGVVLVYKLYEPTRIEAYEIDSGQLLWILNRPFRSRPVLVNNKLLLYTQDMGLEVYDPKTGKRSGYVRLTRTFDKDYVISADSWLAGYDDMVVIVFPNTSELVAIKLDYAEPPE